MKAALATEIGPEARFDIVDLEIDAPKGREVLLDVRASGLCHSDLHAIRNDWGFPVPAVFGHEIAGVVLEVGPAVTDVKVGDHVVACVVPYCGSCRNCLAGRSVDCLHPDYIDRRAGEPPRITMNGEPIVQQFAVGGFADKALVNENILAVIDKEVPFPQACVIGCAVATGAGAVINAAHVRVGDSVAVFGTGGVGLNGISGAVLAGAGRIIAVDIDDAKLDVARRFGATHTVNSSQEDAVAAIRELTGGGVDHSFEFIGLQVTQRQAYECLGKGGSAYVVGMAKSGSTVVLDTSVPFLSAGKAVRGVSMGSTNLKRDIPMYADFYLQGRMNLDDLVSQEIALSEINDAYDQLSRGGIIRSVITDWTR
ncbi:Zn-dependent alcohol dehydrogenase [Microbacterium sp.]|uniref:Zn-dependent alcohol dehydrogenase n=1 Tax=Microbacterium sp. TaxID=51671 RepID=UPI002811C208|nr:Zn-dependent alcohol dehydrogenase [Microbacterium sp.]